MKRSKKYKIQIWIGIDSEDYDPMPLEEAVREIQQLRLLNPENMYDIQEVENE